MADVQIAVDGQQDVQVALSTISETQIVASLPTFQGAVVESIDNLSDVDTATVAPSGGQALVWASGTSQWEPGTVVGSIASGVSGATFITNCIALSQAAYDAIVTPDSSTLYVIV